MKTSADLLSRPFATITELIAAHAVERPFRVALTTGEESVDYMVLDVLLNRIARGLAREGVAAGTPVAIVGGTSLRTTVIFLGILRAGCVPTPIAPSSTPDQIVGMIHDCGAPIVFVDEEAPVLPPLPVKTVAVGVLDAWLPEEIAPCDAACPGPEDSFNIIYSSGTTGTPKGIIHSHAMRWTQVRAYVSAGLGEAVTMVATPLYSNTTLVSLLPTLAYGGTAVLVGRFDARRFLELAERTRATHAMLVPVQYQRIMAVPDFDRFDLSTFRVKTSTSAPFSAELKAEVLRRWPGLLVEIYGLTEGGGICLLFANLHQNKLHTVGCPGPGNDIRLIDEAGREVAPGEIGEVVGRSTIMMQGYHRRDEATKAASWYDSDGCRYIRHGDLGRFDADGFLTLLGRTKDMVISGGFNIYPADLETVLLDHPEVADAAVVGVPSADWGETPYAYLVLRDAAVDAAPIVAWANARLGKTQRLSGGEAIAELPRSPIGKVLKRELRDRFAAAPASGCNEGKVGRCI